MNAESYGQQKLTVVDKLGVYLSRRPVMKVVERYDRATVLDIGCGYHAELLRALEPRIARGVGIDARVSPELAGNPKLAFFEQTIEQAMPELAKEKFDVILMVSVLEHLWEPQEVLTSLRGLLTAGGSLVVNVPNWLGKTFLEVSAFKLGMSPADSIDDHKTYYWKEQLWPLLVRAGFKPSKIAMRYHKLGLNLFAVARAE